MEDLCQSRHEFLSCTTWLEWLLPQWLRPGKAYIESQVCSQYSIFLAFEAFVESAYIHLTGLTSTAIPADIHRLAVRSNVTGLKSSTRTLPHFICAQFF